MFHLTEVEKFVGLSRTKDNVLNDRFLLIFYRRIFNASMGLDDKDIRIFQAKDNGLNFLKGYVFFNAHFRIKEAESFGSEHHGSLEFYSRLIYYQSFGKEPDFILIKADSFVDSLGLAFYFLEISTLFVD